MKNFIVLAVAIGILVFAVIYGARNADKMWTDRYTSQYGKEAIKHPANGQCILKNGEIRALR